MSPDKEEQDHHHPDLLYDFSLLLLCITVKVKLGIEFRVLPQWTEQEIQGS